MGIGLDGLNPSCVSVDAGWMERGGIHQSDSRWIPADTPGLHPPYSFSSSQSVLTSHANVR